MCLHAVLISFPPVDTSFEKSLKTCEIINVNTMASHKEGSKEDDGMQEREERERGRKGRYFTYYREDIEVCV